MTDKICPELSDVKREVPCKEHRCRWYIQLHGKHPQSDQAINEWGCAVEWLPILLIENAQQTRQAGAAIESFRNAMVIQNRQAADKLAARDDDHPIPLAVRRAR